MEIDYIRVYEFENCYNPIFDCGNGVHSQAVLVNQDTRLNECDTRRFDGQIQYITVTNNSTLEINDSELKMILPGKIVIESGSSLLLNNTTIRPCDEGTRWHGIYLEEGANIKLKNNSKLQTSFFGIYNNPDLPNYVNSVGNVSNLDLQYYMQESGGNNSVILNNSILSDNYMGITVDGNDNIISLNPQNTINGSSIASFVRGNIDGYIEYKNVTFENNDIALFANKCGDRHLIQNCNFSNTNAITTQITLDNVEGLDFQLNSMEGPGQLIDAVDSHIDIVNDNEFLNSKSAIWVGGTYPLASSARIGDLNGEANYFSDNLNGIKLSGINSTVGGLVQNNQIENTNKIAIDVDGISLSNISNNTIDNAEDGIYFSKTGGLDNFINCNRFINNGIQDLTIELTNNKTQFLQNDFSGSQNDGNIVLIQARVKNIQGSENNPSDNCFDLNSVDDLYTDPATIEFQYHHNKIIQCRIPSGNGKYQAKDSDDEGDNCPNDQIGSNFVGSTTPTVAITPLPLPPRLTLHPPGIIGTNIDITLTDLVNTGGDDPYTYIDESLPNTEILSNVVYPPAYLANMQAIYNYESELDYWIRVGIQYAIDNNDYTYGENLLLQFKKWRWQEMLFGLYLKSDQFTKARALLNVLPNNTAYELAFVDLQHINLDRLINGDQSITPTQIQTVYTIATGTTPAVGYAIPIYYQLTGIRLTSRVPTKSGGTRNSQDVNIGNGLSVVPNPVMDELTLQNKFDRKLNDITIIDGIFK